MDFSNVRLPKKIEICPIIDAVIELRFESNLPPEIIPGIVYGKFGKRYPKTEKLPLMEVPSSLRDSDPNLMYSPVYKLFNESFIFQIGPRVFSVLCPKEYKGWTSFKAEIL